MEVPVNKDSFLILFLSGPHLAKNSMQLQGTLVFDIHGPNNGHNFFFIFGMQTEWTYQLSKIQSKYYAPK